jgi:hypothetical protein
MMMEAAIFVFSKFDGTHIKNAEFGVVTSDYYHPSLVTDVLFPTGRLLQNQGPYHIQIGLSVITVLLLPSLCIFHGCIVLFSLAFIVSFADSVIGSGTVCLSRELTRPSNRSIHLRRRTAILIRGKETLVDSQFSITFLAL